MKCKKCKYWDNEGFCDAINRRNAVYNTKDKTVYIGYDGYIQTGRNFGCVLYEKGKFIQKDYLHEAYIENKSESKHKESFILKLSTDRNGVKYIDKVIPTKTEQGILDAIQSCLTDNKKLTLRNIAQYAKMSPSTIHRYKYLIGDNNAN